VLDLELHICNKMEEAMQQYSGLDYPKGPPWVIKKVDKEVVGFLASTVLVEDNLDFFDGSMCML
jgi:hypothetical protein